MKRKRCSVERIIEESFERREACCRRHNHGELSPVIVPALHHPVALGVEIFGVVRVTHESIPVYRDRQGVYHKSEEERT